MIKKTSYIVIFFCILINLKNKCFGISQDFKFVVDTIGIPQYNVYGEEINEDIYYAYNVFVYSNPLNMYSKTSTQRFKAVPNNGKWTENGGVYTGSGVRGEYYVLGTSYSGSLIDNVFFPVDAIPETTPDNWRYIIFAGAYESWFDTSKYKYAEQLDFMKNSNLLFDRLDYTNNTSDSYNLVEYNIKPITIGLDKMKLNTASTWKTMGIITAKRINNKGQTRNAIFATKPMAASASISSKLNVGDVHIIYENEDEKNIKINFGANAINLNEYAKEKHIKEICSVVYINGKETARVMSSGVRSISKDINFKLNRDNYVGVLEDKVEIKVESYLYTEFSVDGLMRDSITKNITIQIQPKKIVPVKNIDLKVIEKNNNEISLLPFIKTIETTNKDSVGLVENGRNIAAKLDISSTEEILNIELYLNGEKTEFIEVGNKNDNFKIIEFNLKQDTQVSLASWNYLRQKSGNYFDIDFNEIGKRIKEPNILKIVSTVNENKYEKEVFFDNIDDYNLNINYIFNNGVLNKEEINDGIKIDDWK